MTKTLSVSTYDITPANSYESGLDQLQMHTAQNQLYDGVILGWPGKTDPIADEVIAMLVEPDFQEMAVLIMAMESEPATLNWVVKRINSVLLLWDDYQESRDAFEKLLSPSSDISPKSAIFVPEGETERENIKILFVDDSPTVRVSFRKLLLNHGYTVDTASSAKEGFEKARKQQYDIAIVDYFMPGGNGDILCRQLRSDPNTASMISAIFTGTYADQVIKDALDAGAVECMFKNEADELFLARMEAMSRLIHTRRSIEKEQRRLHGILNSVGDGVYGVSHENRITFVNPAVKNILGYKETDNLIGKIPHEVFHYAHSDGVFQDMDSCFLTQAYGLGDELHSWETMFWSAAKKPIPVECTVYPLIIDNKQQGSVVAFRDISERKLLEEELKWQVNHDHMTKLLNRHFFDEELRKEVWRLSRSTESSALLYIDLDRFKYLNDTVGHSAGDQLLIESGQVLSKRLRKTDLLARLGGDEFAVILRNIAEADAFVLAEQYRTALNQYCFTYNGKQYTVDCSIGVAHISKESQSPDEVLANADIACHIAKENGRNQTHIYASENDAKKIMDMELGWVSRLRDALEQNKFVLYYQPILPVYALDIDKLPEDPKLFAQSFDCNSLAEPIHYEVLVRLLGNDGELIPPNAFLPTAERFNMMRDIDRWIFTRAIEDIKKQFDKGKVIQLGINLSGNSMGDETLLPYIKEVLQKSQVDSYCILFEITETAAISNIGAAQKLIKELRALGCRFALDDFGCGFSSFGHLKQLPVDFIKIDGMFVQGMVSDPMDQAMVRAITDIAHSVGKKTIAEYVESSELVRLLQQYGVDYVQGYYVGRPSPDFLQ